MKYTEDQFAVRITRKDGTVFLAYGKNLVAELFRKRQDAVLFKMDLNSQGKIAMHKLKTVKVRVEITELQ